MEDKPGETGGEKNSGGEPRRFDEDMLVHGELLSDFVKQSFLDPNDDRIVDRILDAVIPGVGVPFRDFMTRDQAKAMLKKAQEKMLAVSPEAIPVSPQQRRRGARKRLADRPKSVAATLHAVTELSQAFALSVPHVEAIGGSSLSLLKGEANVRVENVGQSEVQFAPYASSLKLFEYPDSSSTTELVSVKDKQLTQFVALDDKSIEPNEIIHKTRFISIPAKTVLGFRLELVIISNHRKGLGYPQTWCY